MDCSRQTHVYSQGMHIGYPTFEYLLLDPRHRYKLFALLISQYNLLFFLKSSSKKSSGSCNNLKGSAGTKGKQNNKLPDRYGELSYFEFIWLLIVELQVDREHGYFTHAHQTGFGEQYEELFRGSEGNLCGTWVGYDVLNDAITRVMLHWDDPSVWAWSCGVFAFMFSEPCRFVRYHDKLGEIMTTKCNVRMLGRFYFLKVLPKKWREISICARKKRSTHNEDLEAQPDLEKYSKTGAKNLEFSL
ncbi:symplekin isoform X2 [Tanacetum coccineum]